MINFNTAKKFFDDYIQCTYLEIKEQFFHLENDDYLTRFNLRNAMIKQKYDHTMRVVENITKLAERIGQSINFIELTKVVGLLHDVGRFEQVLYSDTYVDSEVYKNHPTLKNHAEEGELFLNQYGFNAFDISKKYQPTIAICTGLHQLPSLPKNFNYQVPRDFGKINPDLILNGSYNFNELELQIISLLLQMVRDIDKIDILYQRANGEIKAIPEILKVKNIGKEKIENLWGVSLTDLKELNSCNELDNSPIIKVNSKNIPIEKLFVSDDIKTKIYTGEKMSLKELQNRCDYSFITAIWWSLYTFLSDINFVSNLEVIQENNLLNQIYNQYPAEYRPLINEIFIYAKFALINEQIQKNKHSLYLKKDKKRIKFQT